MVHRKIVFENVLITEGGFTLIVSNQGQKRKLVPYAEKVNFEPQYNSKEHGIRCPHLDHSVKFLDMLKRIERECAGFVVSSDETIPKWGQSVQGLKREDYQKLFNLPPCKNNVTARHGYCSSCNKKFKEWRKVRQLFSNRYFRQNFMSGGHDDSEIELLHEADDCWPLRIHSNDWVGFLQIPGKEVDDCRLNIPAHEDIVDAVMLWLDRCGDARCEHEKCNRVDNFVKSAVSRFHEKICDATTMQYLLPEVSVPPPYNLHLDYKQNVDAAQMCEIVNRLVNEFFPESDFAEQTINFPMNHRAYYRRESSTEGKTDYEVPVRIVMSSFALATALEESNRGDARWSKLKDGFSAYYANIWMPMGIFFLMRNGATLAKAKKAIKQA